MRKELILLTAILTILISCSQTNNEETNRSVDSGTSVNGTEANIDKDPQTAKPETTNTALGLGLVAINFDDKTTLDFYSAPNDKKPNRTIQFFNDETISSWNIRDLDKHAKWLKPEILQLDYSQFVFRCITVQDDWFNVMVNNETEETLWLKKNKWTTFSNWENFLKEMFGVARLTNQQQKIRTLPTEDAEEIIYKGQDCFQVKSMKGDWIEIYTADYCDKHNTDIKTKIKSGWIKWREGNKLLIEYFAAS